MPQTMGWERRSTWLPPQPDASAELAVPEPAPEARDALGRRTVWESDGRTLSFAVFHAAEKRRCIGVNPGGLFACSVTTPLVVRQPPPLHRPTTTHTLFGT